MKYIFLICLVLFVSCKGAQKVAKVGEVVSPWEKKMGIPDSAVWSYAYEVQASEIRGTKLKQVLQDPNNNTLPVEDSESLVAPDFGWESSGKRVFWIRILPNSLYREVNSLGEVGVRLGECDSKEKIEYPYTYYVFPTELGKGRDRVPKYLQENDSATYTRKRSNYNHYMEETRYVLVAFPNYCFRPGVNYLEVQLLGAEFFLFRFVFEY